jgi:guanylate kinase
MKKRQVVVIAGPSGSGKNSVIDTLLKRFTKCSLMTNATTRAPREGEREGVDYYYFSGTDFKKSIENGNILEYRHVPSLGTYYGTYKPDLEKRIAKGDIVLAHKDIIGARYLKEHYDAVTIFLLPESMESLEKRVHARNPGMSKDEFEERMKMVRREVEEEAPQYDYRLVNEDGELEKTVEEVIAILKKEGYNLE